MSERPKFLVIDEDIHPAGIDHLKEAGEVVICPSTTPEDDLLQHLSGVVGILVRKGQITRRLVEGAPDLKIVARHGVGVDSVDLKALAERGILLTITGSANSRAVAEYTFAMMLALTRNVSTAYGDLKKGQWTPNRYIGAEVGGKVMGVVGFGQIGGLVCDFANGFGMQTLVVDPLVPAETIEARGFRKAEYDALLEQVDFLSYHVRLTDQTRGMFGNRELEIVKPGVRIVNTARGGICDEDALLRGLNSGRIAGIALDTFEEEPLPPDSPLLSHPNALLSPHVAGQTGEAVRNMAVTAAESVTDCVAGREPKYLYPLPK